MKGSVLNLKFKDDSAVILSVVCRVLRQTGSKDLRLPDDEFGIHHTRDLAPVFL